MTTQPSSLPFPSPIPFSFSLFKLTSSTPSRFIIHHLRRRWCPASPPRTPDGYNLIDIGFVSAESGGCGGGAG